MSGQLCRCPCGIWVQISRLIWIYERDGAVDLTMREVVHMSWLAAIFHHQKFQVPKVEESWTLQGCFWVGFPLHKPYIQLVQVSTSSLGTWNVLWFNKDVYWFVSIFLLAAFQTKHMWKKTSRHFVHEFVFDYIFSDDGNISPFVVAVLFSTSSENHPFLFNIGKNCPYHIICA